MNKSLYFLPIGYRQRTDPQYFQDDGSSDIIWQPDVYTEALSIAKRHNRNVIIDLGCGRATKLSALAEENPDLKFFGVDYGENFRWCLEKVPQGKFFEVDLEIALTIDIDASIISRSVVVCSDVLEHLINPLSAMALIRWLLKQGSARAILSTPARDKRAGLCHLGPPYNPSHVREWACDEFCAFVESCGLDIETFSLTRSDDKGGGKTTQLAIVRL
ncbi:class I SAM-dependent methyltransferase [Rhizobium rhizogenes]|uniref:class I SAM-dependent methyltransferase n=1 Tax=Rhizobium rhizogenes TaxID=359 RepID=UPI0015722453|nr:class I SAM-dependent methyltransferase [Rhizobium rhizogenes]NTH23017.1 class I SAM-dependent methyltransferase [Rhizobium rhizogenes]NTH36047.1 class I SAM-dependent methyltransferase [Rhizobium rhizogenes]